MSAEQMNLCPRDGLGLPLRTAPIRFAVTRKDGRTSNSWGVCVEPKGDAYIYCRDGMTDQHASLHASGKQHIRINDSALRKSSLPGDSYMNEWWEPQHSTQAVPTLRLLFPTWGLSLDARHWARVQASWDKNDVLIPAHAEMVTVVSFVIVDNGTRLRKEDGSPPSAPLGLLGLGLGKSLFVIAGYEPESDLRAVADEALRRIARPPEVELSDGEDLVMCLTGNTVENSVFMLPLSVRYRRRTD